MSSRRPAGQLAIVLHTHMPYVEGFGTWPFGEEWLWEAIVGSYLPLLELLDEGAPLTLSLTPVLCDQLEAPGVPGRFEAFVEEVRAHTHEQDIVGLRAGGFEALARELERSWEEYRAALGGFRALGGDLLGSLGRHASWTSSATHAVLPLLATDAGVSAQVRIGVQSHRARFAARDGVGDRQRAGGWGGGFWLPECAHAPHLEPLLAQAGVRATCVELTARHGLGAREHLRPLIGEAGVVLVPIDRATIARVWSDRGYPAHACYRDYHQHTNNHHKPWANDGSEYDHDRALALARGHAREFVTATLARLRESGAGLPGGGLAVCALDTELLGHWWYEGVHWLRAVVGECERQGLELVLLDDAAALAEPASVDTRRWRPSTWGRDGDLSTWSGPAVADMAFASRDSELRALAAVRTLGPVALRELLALQSSDWAFMVSRGLAVPYARERFDGHRQRLERALDLGGIDTAGGGTGAPQLRNLAPGASPSALLAL